MTRWGNRRAAIGKLGVVAPSNPSLAADDPHHQHLQRRWALEQGLLEDRRQHLLLAASQAAAVLRERWPALGGVWLFGSVLKPAAFQRHSTLDLVVAGLPATAQLEAPGLVERVVDPLLALP